MELEKIVAILVAIQECKNGVLLIDEIDNGLHYSVMPLLWKAIFESAKINYTQIFATTHSIDSMRSIQNTVNENNQFINDFGGYKLIRTEDDQLHSVRYNFEQFKYAINQEIEIR